MNRTFECNPHTCGDEPIAERLAERLVIGNPHTCGDEPQAVDLFYGLFIGNPHTCGDEPTKGAEYYEEH